MIGNSFAVCTMNFYLSQHLYWNLLMSDPNKNRPLNIKITRLLNALTAAKFGINND